MAYFFFIDESGRDRRDSPYEVLAGVSVQDRDLWNLIKSLHDAEIRHFGRRYSAGTSELKGRKILKRKVFRHAADGVEVAEHEVRSLAKKVLDDGERAGKRELKALALAKLDYVREVFGVCGQFRCQAFASIVETDAHPTALGGLRKDYAYLFQRFYYYLEDRGGKDMGVVVFDELEKARSHVLIEQTYRYFKETAVGRERARLIVPEPFFVHSDLTTGIQIADLVAYVASWGFRMPTMTKPARAELEEFAGQVAKLRYKTYRRKGAIPEFEIWSFAHIRDLRTQLEREGE